MRVNVDNVLRIEKSKSDNKFYLFLLNKENVLKINAEKIENFEDLKKKLFKIDENLYLNLKNILKISRFKKEKIVFKTKSKIKLKKGYVYYNVVVKYDEDLYNKVKEEFKKIKK